MLRKAMVFSLGIMLACASVAKAQSSNCPKDSVVTRISTPTQPTPGPATLRVEPLQCNARAVSTAPRRTTARRPTVRNNVAPTLDLRLDFVALRRADSITNARINRLGDTLHVVHQQVADVDRRLGNVESRVGAIASQRGQTTQAVLPPVIHHGIFKNTLTWVKENPVLTVLGLALVGGSIHELTSHHPPAYVPSTN